MPTRLIIGWLLLLVSAAAWPSPPALEIEVTGVSDEILANVRTGLSINLQRDHPLLDEGLIRRYHRNAPAEIRRALEPFGYYDPGIESALEYDGTRWIARYRIDPGEPVRIATVRIDIDGPGADDPALQHWQEEYPLAPGDVLRHGDYEAAKDRLRRIARDHGYFDGTLERHRVTVDTAGRRADIELHYVTGIRYAFGEITIDQEEFDEAFLRRYLPFRSGDPWDATQLLALRRSFADSDYFAIADVIPLHDEARDGSVPIRIVLEARKRKLYTAGIGYATDTGARTRLGFEERRANRRGHRYGATLRVSEVESSVTARYVVPLERPVSDSLTWSALWLDENTDTTDRTTASIGADITRQLGRWLRSTGLSYEWERFTIGGVEERTLLLIPNVRWQRIEADQRIQTRRGWIFSIGFRGAAESLFSDTSFAQVRSDGKYIIGLTGRTRLLLRATGGASWTPEFTELPTSQRFFAGGDQSVRGYAYRSLGPRDDLDRVIGGRHLLVGSTEIEFGLTAHTAVAAFYDLGNAFNGDDLESEAGAGVGLRWQTPIGAVRLDLAQALTRDGRPWRLHLTLGPDL